MDPRLRVNLKLEKSIALPERVDDGAAHRARPLPLHDSGVEALQRPRRVQPRGSAPVPAAPPCACTRATARSRSWRRAHALRCRLKRGQHPPPPRMASRAASAASRERPQRPHRQRPGRSFAHRYKLAAGAASSRAAPLRTASTGRADAPREPPEPAHFAARADQHDGAAPRHPGGGDRADRLDGRLSAVAAGLEIVLCSAAVFSAEFEISDSPPPCSRASPWC